MEKRDKSNMTIQLHPEKNQHLLLNEEIIERIIKEADISKKDKIIEIGAGTGILTKAIADKAGKVLAFETDENFKKELDKIKSENLKIIYKNALNYSWKNYDKIVSNIPYSLSEPLIINAIHDNIKFIVLTIGENFKRILDEKETKIGIIADLFYNITPILKIDKKEFIPVPRVNSWLVKFEKKENLTKTEAILQKVVLKSGKIKNAIIYSLVESGKTKNQARGVIKNLNIDELVLNKLVKSITGRFLMLLRERLEGVI